MSARSRVLLTTALLAAVALIGGCTFQAVKLSATGVVPHDPTRGREVSGQACGFMLGGVIPIAMSNRDQRAFDVLRRAAEGDYVTNVQAEQHMTYAFVGWTICTQFHATAYPRI